MGVLRASAFFFVSLLACGGKLADDSPLDGGGCDGAKCVDASGKPDAKPPPPPIDAGEEPPPAGPKGKRSWVDGPFAESKELVAGYSILEVPSKRDALAWADRYAAILDGNEVDVRSVL